MIEFTTGNILNDIKENTLIVVPCNNEGVCGAGLNKQVANKYDWYKRICGVTAYSLLNTPVIQEPLVLFATKDKWKENSKLEYIINGLTCLKNRFNRMFEDNEAPCIEIRFPKLGCGLGGLSWDKVKPLIINFAMLLTTDKVLIKVYE